MASLALLHKENEGKNWQTGKKFLCHFCKNIKLLFYRRALSFHGMLMWTKVLKIVFYVLYNQTDFVLDLVKRGNKKPWQGKILQHTNSIFRKEPSHPKKRSNKNGFKTILVVFVMLLLFMVTPASSFTTSLVVYNLLLLAKKGMMVTVTPCVFNPVWRSSIENGRTVGVLRF